MSKNYNNRYIAVLFLIIVSAVNINSQVQINNDVELIKRNINNILDYYRKGNADSSVILIKSLLTAYPYEKVSGYKKEEIFSLQQAIRTIQSGINEMNGDPYFDSLKNYTSSIDRLENTTSIQNELTPRPEPITTQEEQPDKQLQTTPQSSGNIIWIIFGIAWLILLGAVLWMIRNINNMRTELNTFKRKILDETGRGKGNYNSPELNSARFDNLDADIRSLQEEFSRHSDHINKRTNKIDSRLEDVEIKMSAIKELNTNYNNKKEENITVIKNQVDEYHKEKKVKDYDITRVEYFSDMGNSNFRKTNSSTPFYIKKFGNKSELYVDDGYEISPYYIDQIKQCFNLTGSGKRKFKVNEPAECYQDKNNIWTLRSKGELQS